VRLGWLRGRAKQDDPYWEAFINRPPADPNNEVTHAFKQVEPGGVNPIRTAVHSPNVMAQHVKELARFYGADEVGIVELDSSSPESQFGIVCVLRAEDDVESAPGIGGQMPAMKGLFATFTLGAYIRELGYTARSSEVDRQRLAVAAGLGALERDGRLNSHRFGRNVFVADVLLTDLPLEADGHT
jgi:hypothetical protein